jgi:hypothetical protein
MKLMQLIYISRNAKQKCYLNILVFKADKIPYLKMCVFLFLVNSKFIE